jgi:glc operon protein GlcG
MHPVPELDHEDALAGIAAVRAAHGEEKGGIVVAVVDAHGELLSLLRLAGAPLSSIGVATNKAFSAARLRRPSGETGRRVRHPETGFDISYYGDPRYVGWGGGLPIRVDETVVGAVAVSGLSDREDEVLAEAGVAAILRRNADRSR